MPGGDGTGPMGQGPLTGRGMGPCGRGLRRGFGRGFGFSRAYGTPVEFSKDEKIKILEADKAEIEAELKEINKTIQELKKNA